MSDYLFDVTQGQVVYIERCFTDSTGLGTAVSSGSACVKRMSDQTLGPGCTAITTSGGLATLSVTTGSSSVFYVKGDYSVYMGAGTVGGVSVIGYTLAQFSIGKLTAFTFSTDVLKWNGTAVSTPATAGIPDVNVKNIDNDAASASGTVTFPAGTLPSTTSTLSANVILWQASAPNVLISGRVDANANAAIATATVSANVIQVAGQTAAAAGAVTFPGTIASSTNITSGTITTVTNLTNAPTVGDFTSTMKTSIQTAVTAVTVSADVLKWNGTLVSTPATAGIPDVNVKNIGGVVYTAATLSATLVGVSTTGSTSIQNAVWDTPLASHAIAGSAGAALSAAGTAGDPWLTPLPGAYGAGTAGKLIGNAINATTFTVSTGIMTAAALANFFNTDSGTNYASSVAGSVVKETADNAGGASLTVQQIVDGVWNEPLPGTHTTTSTAGKLIGNAINFTTYTMSANVVSINAVSTSPVTTVKAVQGLTTADTITTVTNLTNAPTVGDFTATMKTSIQTQVTAVTVSADVKSINSVSTSPVTTVKAVQGLTTADQVTTAVNLTTNNDKTGYALSAAGNNSAADAFLLRDIATGASATDRNVQNTFRAIRNKTSITTTGQLIVCQEDDIATAWTAVTTTTTAQSISSIDPT